MDSKSLELLEFPKVRELLAGHTSFEVSHALAHQIVPLTDAAAIARLLEQSSQARRLLDEDPSFGIGQLADIREPAKMAALGKVLDSVILLEMEQMLATMRVLRRALGRHSSTFPRLWEIAASIKEMPEIEKEIARCISPNGDDSPFWVDPVLVRLFSGVSTPEVGRRSASGAAKPRLV
jgi:DNA mismatch repair protein MutS2